MEVIEKLWLQTRAEYEELQPFFWERKEAEKKSKKQQLKNDIEDLKFCIAKKRKEISEIKPETLTAYQEAHSYEAFVRKIRYGHKFGSWELMENVDSKEVQ